MLHLRRANGAIVLIDILGFYLLIGISWASVVFIRNATLPKKQQAGELGLILLCTASTFLWPLLLVIFVSQFIAEKKGSRRSP